ncbi:NADH dehydrogenase [ubiquinone] 1 beta subcomplex subunit 3-like [Amphibalanus amphitrite]|uniref:NADH dehydrogenase [ubiquinone] 1 beta subcomplex subunit 3-like n=1 Tax=Amphibalanus amphitrite TaxID=1232801 RepID=UPI001C9116CF|nr:NADH dehydrogenase [ubiquinone] 1 beta subcomplex subunit 3-like [Amphibalanus amphitrite]XP_043199781.1 NADH dehydrogenase [ubiquinone] 1 beta subcomplex subunit 3-like [Amphibalanus amphitrite]XP_043244574.1 NADH dehydrogenase [ubiquinone] 1 beta subcomplex subunit 3-like [Amphibalanus amphitrite]XP_043244575.1 NADH dehydrogenase [ubiquinone] 1 beta subcomplex subunit 3-like [Amphibalanus amphitrite]
MGGGGRPYEIPDWRKYKVEDAPELVNVRNALAQKGLKDPWLRNEVWKYDQKMFLKPNERMTRFFFRGFKYAAAAMVVTIAADKLGLLGSSDHGHGHH